MRRPAFALCLVTLLAATHALAAHEEVLKPVKGVIGSVRHSQDKIALRYFAIINQGKRLVGDDWVKGTDAQRKEFQELFALLFAKIAFPKVREDFKYLDSITYGEPEVKADQAFLNSVISIQHPLKKQEIKLKYELVKEGSGWKVVDVTVLGDSMLQGIKEDQVAPILKEGGWPHLLDLMRQKAKELEGVPLK